MSNNARRHFKVQRTRIELIRLSESARTGYDQSAPRRSKPIDHLAARRKVAIKKLNKRVPLIAPYLTTAVTPSEEVIAMARWIDVFVTDECGGYRQQRLSTTLFRFAKLNSRGTASASKLLVEVIEHLMRLGPRLGKLRNSTMGALFKLLQEQTANDCLMIFSRLTNLRFFERLGGVRFCDGSWCTLLRWALDKATTTDRLSYRDLDWASLAKMNAAKKADYIPNLTSRYFYLWRSVGVRFGGVVHGQIPPPKGFSVRTYTALFNTISTALRDNGHDIYFSDSLFKVTVLFGRDVDGASRFVRSYLEHMELPDTPESWLEACISCARNIPVTIEPGWKKFIIGQLRNPHLEEILRSRREIVKFVGRVPSSMSEVNSAYRRAGKAADFSLTDAERLFITKKPHKHFEACPGVEVAHEGYTLSKLAYDDPTQLTAGRLVHCCQHLGGEARDCAEKAWTSWWCAIYAAYKGERMVAQTFAWRALDGTLVFDSIEALSNVNSKALAQLFAMAAKRLVGRLGVTSVMVGINGHGITKTVLDLVVDSGGAFKDVHTLIQPMEVLEYTDTSRGCVVISDIPDPN